MTPAGSGPRAALRLGAGLLRQVPPGERRHAAQALALLLLLGATEGVGLLLILPVLAVVGVDLGDGALGRGAGSIADAAAALGVRPSLGPLLVAYVAVIAAHAAAQRQLLLATGRTREAVIRGLRRRLYEAVSRMEWAAFTRLRSAEVGHAMMVEADRAGAAASSLLHLATQAFLTLVHLALAALLSPALVLVALAAASGLLVVVRSRRQAAYRRGVAAAEAERALSAAVGDLLAGAKTLRAHGLDDQARAWLEARFDGAAAERVGVDRTHAAAQFGLEVGAASAVAVLVAAAVALEVSAATLLVLLFIFARVARRASGLHYQWQAFLGEAGAVEGLEALAGRCEAARDPGLERGAGEAGGIVTLRDGLRLEEVSYTYPGRDRPAVGRVDLEVPAGQVTVLVGPSGAGKTTLADLVLGLLAPDDGRVMVDGRALRPEDMPAWRRRVAYVPQEPFLLPGSVRENLAWVRPDAVEEEMRHALRLAGAEEVVERLPGGLDGVVGERGALLSGGERQRLALACALLRAPDLLVLDEPTSALDAASEARVWEAIAGLAGAVTVLVISHRPAALEGVANRLVALEASGAEPLPERRRGDASHG